MDEHSGDDRGEAVGDVGMGEYGVLVVPPMGDGGGWLVSVAAWNVSSESYVSSGAGPILDSQEEAVTEATRVMAWLREHAGEFDAAHVWDRLQRARAADERGDDPSRPWGRF
jgi:hypothetical protein